MAVVDVEFRANANFSGLISQANMANAAISKLQASVTSLNAEQINQAFAEFSRGLTGSGQYIAQTVRVSDATQRFGQDLVNNKLQLKDYAREFGNYVTGRESQIKKLADQQVRLQRSMVVTRGTDSTGRLVAQVFTPTGLSNDLETNAMRATSRIQVMNEFLHKASTAVVNWGKNTQWAGRQMTVGLTVPLSMLATATGKAFYELDTQLIQMQKVYGTGIKGVGDEAIASIRSQVTQLSQELAKAYGIPVAQTAALAAEIAQAGKTGNELLASVEQTTKLATLGEIDRQDAMKATLSIQSTFNQNTQELSDSINFLNSVENATNVSLQDLVTGIPKAGPVVKALGGDIKDLSLMMVAMKEGGIPASEAANAIKSSLASLINPTEKVTQKMKTFGIDLVSIVDKNAGQLMPTLMEFRGELNKLDDLSRQRILEELFGKFQFARVNALFNNLGRAGSQTVQVMELMGLSTAELASIADKELKTMAESASGRFKRLWATVQGDLAVAGEGILNAGSMILSVISKIINGFEQLPDGLKKFLGGTALLAAVIGPIIMTIGVLGNFFGYIMKGLALMRSFGRRGAGDFQLMTAETVAMANAGSILENTFFEQAKAADVMRTSIEQLTASLAEMGTVSSTAGAAAASTIASAEGRGMGAVTAINAQAMASMRQEDIHGGHMLPALQIEQAVGTGEGMKTPFNKIAGGLVATSAEFNLDLGSEMMMIENTTDELQKQLIAHVSANEAALEVFGEEFGKNNVDTRKQFVGILRETAGDMALRNERLIAEMGIQNPAKLMSDFYAAQERIARERAITVKRVMKLQGTELTAEWEAAKARLGAQYKPGKGAPEFEVFIAQIEGLVTNLEAQGDKTIRNRMALYLDQIRAEYGQTVTGGTGGTFGRKDRFGSDVYSVDYGVVGQQAGTSVDAAVKQQEDTVRRGIRKMVSMKQGQARAAGVSVEKLNLAIQEILNDANLTLEQRAAQIAAYDISNVPGAGVPVVAPGVGGLAGDKEARRAARSRGLSAAGGAIGMGAMMASTMLPSGSAQNIAMTASTATMFAPQIILLGKELAQIDKVKRFGEAISGLTSKFKLLGGASNALRGLGAALMGPVGLAIAATVALGVGVYTLFKNLEKGFKESQSYLDSSKESAQALGYKYEEINFNVEKLTKSTDKAKKSVEELTKTIEDAPATNPLKKMADDFENDADSSDTVRKAVAFFQLQIARGVSASTAREQLAAVLTAAGKEVLIPEINIKIGKINIDDKAANLAGAITTALETSKKKGPTQVSETFQVGAQSLVAGYAALQDKLEVGSNKYDSSGTLETLAEDIQAANNAYDEGAMTDLANNIGQIAQAQAQLDPTKFKEFQNTLADDKALQGALELDNGLGQLTQAFINASGNSANPMWDAGRLKIQSISDLTTAMALNFYRVIPAADAAGRAVQLSFAQASASALQAAAGSINYSSIIKSPMSGGPAKRTTGGAGSDPYKGQKDANQKRIDQEKDIIKAIEKKRDAEKKAFDEKKKQDEYLNKQADLQIGYREALATGDFAAAARVKNEILAEQARKREEDAQKKKDDKYQRDIDSRQGNVDKLEEANKGLDKLSQKAREAAQASSGAISTAYTDNITKAKEQMDIVLERSLTQNSANAQDMKNQNVDVSNAIKAIGGDVDNFFDAAFKASETANKTQIGKIEGLNDDLRDLIVRQQYNNSQLMKLVEWLAKPENQDATPKEIETRILQLRSIGVMPNHDGGPIGPGMVPNRLGKSMRGPIANDERFILAQDGEYMISATAAGIIGRNNLDAINNGKLPAVPVSGGNSGSNYNFTVNAAPGQDAKQIAQEVHRIFQINERRKGGART